MPLSAAQLSLLSSLIPHPNPSPISESQSQPTTPLLQSTKYEARQRDEANRVLDLNLNLILNDEERLRSEVRGSLRRPKGQDGRRSTTAIIASRSRSRSRSGSDACLVFVKAASSSNLFKTLQDSSGLFRTLQDSSDGPVDGRHPRKHKEVGGGQGGRAEGWRQGLTR